MGIYWVYFENQTMELRIQVEADGKEAAIKEASKIADKFRHGFKATKAMPCR